MSKGFARRFLLLLTALAVTGVVVPAGGVIGAPVITKLVVCVNTAHPVQRTAATASTVCKPGWVLVSSKVSEVRPVTTHATTTRRATTTTRASGSSYRSAVMSDRPIAYWRFASTRSETGRHNGKLRGRPAPRLNQPGPFAGDRSIRFDGILRGNARTGGFLANSLARLASSTWSKGFTLEAWVRTTTSGPEQHVMTWSDRAGNAGPGILYDDPDNRWKFRDGNVSLSEADRTTINAWHYLVASIDAAGHGILYVDGVRERTWTSTKHPIATSTGLWTVGADYDAHTCPCPHVDTPFSGWIAETAVYAHPLTAARVRAHLAARRLQRRA